MSEPTEPTAVVVTGAAGDIGRAICRRLLQGGFDPIVTDIDSQLDSLPSTGPDLVDLDRQVIDVRDSDSVRAGVDAIGERVGRLYGLVNCAGILRDTALGNLDDHAIEQMFQVNVAGTARMTDAAAPLIVDGGAIVNIGSVTGSFGRFVGASMYGATKAGIAAYTRYLANELGPRRIRVNNVAPGVIDNPMSPSMEFVSGGAERCVGYTMLGRLGEPEEVAEVVEFLISRRASYVTAQTLLVDGGVVGW